MKLHLTNESPAGWRTVVDRDGEVDVKVGHLALDVDAGDANRVRITLKRVNLESKMWETTHWVCTAFDISLTCIEEVKEREEVPIQ